MKCPVILPSEPARLKALSAYGFDDEQLLQSLDPVVRIASRMFGMPVAAVNMIGSDHVFFAASTGVGHVDMRRDVSFCAHAINQADVMLVPDATLDERFHDNPLVTGDTNLRFYAGVPLMSPEGLALGALCIIDDQPHHDFSPEDCKRLQELAKMASDRLELRRIEVAAERSTPQIQEDASSFPTPHEEQELRQQASVDGLTGLANRAKFYRQVEDVLIRPAPVALMMIDIDGFKDVNDTLGHTLGDAILRELATRLQQLVGEGDLAARIGGDEFALMLTGMTDAGAATQLAEAILVAIARPIKVDSHQVHISASCGIALAPAHTQEALELVGDADLALFKAKRVGRGRVYVFTPSLRMEAMARRLYGLELHRAVDKGEFVLFYQPQISLSDGSITGAEALIRWHHPERGILAPAVFLPALEGGPLAATVGSWILNEACAQAAYWRRSGAPRFRIGINLSGAQFQVGDLATEVMETLARHGLPPEALELEVTENIVLDNDDIVLGVLRRLHAQGVGIAFDDFGTGYASLSLLKSYPLSRIKMDQSFVRGILTSKRDASVVRAILDMARNFDLETIAEGVEYEAEYNYLRREHCDEAQGFLFGKPMSAPQFELMFGIGRAKAIA
ncbi:MAG TPA: sensor domain-containing phosphodiesterase [Cellvibrio sp.]|nr:sensor domain-containing phosphodiesterase [Cellvibrio sp.]